MNKKTTIRCFSITKASLSAKPFISKCLIQEPKGPEVKKSAASIFDVIFHHPGIRDISNLANGFIFSAYLKQVLVVEQEIAFFRVAYLKKYGGLR